MISEMTIITAMDISFQFCRGDIEQLRSHGEGVNAELFRALVRKGTIKFGLSRCYQVYWSLQFRDFQLLLAERDHTSVSLLVMVCFDNRTLNYKCSLPIKQN